MSDDFQSEINRYKEKYDTEPNSDAQQAHPLRFASDRKAAKPAQDALPEDPAEILRVAAARLQQDIEQDALRVQPQDVVRAAIEEARQQARQAPPQEMLPQEKIPFEAQPLPQDIPQDVPLPQDSPAEEESPETPLTEEILPEEERFSLAEEERPPVEGSKPTEYEDILTHERPSGFFGGLHYDLKYRLRPYFLKNNKASLKRWSMFTALGLALVLLFSGGIFAANKLVKLYAGEKVTGDPSLTEALEDNPNVKNIYEVTDAAGLNELLYGWQTKGDLMSDRNVINILLLGVDSNDGQMSGARADAIMIASLNKKTQKITLVSVMRDCYVYMRVGNSDRYDKLNHAYMWGGPELLQITIESLYKIKINNYVCVDFATFPKLIDELGGVNVTVTKRESDYNLKKFQHRLPVGNDVTLNGDQALMFSRIRKLDNDDQRARRQRAVISGIIQKTKSAQVGQLNAAVDILLKNVRTDLKSGEIFSWGTQALTQGWMQYDLGNYTAPSAAHRRDAHMTTSSYPNHKLWVWVADFPLSAQELQTLLYGESNIVLADDRQSPLQLMRPAANSGNSGQSSSNNNGGGSITTLRPSAQQSTNRPQPTNPQPSGSQPVNPPTDPPSGTQPTDPPTDPPSETQPTSPPTEPSTDPPTDPPTEPPTDPPPETE